MSHATVGTGLSWLVLAVVASGTIASIVGAAYAADVSGPARVIDGDTLEVGSARVRLFGIDAPETAQDCRDTRGRQWRCGEAAATRLKRLIGNRTVTCAGRGLDDYGRLLGVCSVAGRELNASLVREGFAWAFVKYAPDYAAIEREARAARRGVFAAENAPPWNFREAKWNRATSTAAADRARKCPIKGNVSKSGARVYHMPWQRDYARTKISERTGERWFCDEGEAERAGWRRAAR
jgi:endonuclease YncB( thermonuclease family)